ncbi:hypothetical protein [Spirosoma sp. 48-14]|uniref:hypothetical protein n=1 Tax=Spirosoma sp. 48-14 TaxID=1895854 RepID=UPI000965B20D|nr:hypothetical protein [Spirosoma sp. 48-14]OJW77615.1 MAG: hypothetical protein BGO59_28785 [Spirosoma sp. 48-14]
MKKLAFIILLLLVSCKDNSTLGNNYYYLTRYEAEDNGYPYGSIIYKSKQKNLYSKIIIYSDVIKVKSNKNYIITMQKPNINILKSIIKDDITFWKEHYLKTKKDSIVILSYDTISLKKISKLLINSKSIDSIIKNKEPYSSMLKQKHSNNYYIIDKNKNIVIGPLTKYNFEKIKLQMSIKLDF